MVRRILGLLATLLFILGSHNSFASKAITGAGATFPYPVYSAWSYMYYGATGIKVNYQAIGSGAGIKQIASRVVDFGASDAPLTPQQQQKLKLLQFPAVIGGVVPVVNIPGIKPGQLRLTGKILAMIFMGKIKKWNDPAIANINRSLKLPDKSITVIHRSDGSGTTAIFTTYLSRVCTQWKNKIGSGKAVNWPVGLGGKGNPGVANYVKRIKYSIGYVEFAYATENKLNYITLKNSSGKFVSPSFSSFRAAAKSARWDPSKGYYLWLVNAPGKNSWPIAGATFILLAKEKKKTDKQVVKFFNWAFEHGDSIAKKLIYVPLPKNLRESIRSYWKKNNIY